MKPIFEYIDYRLFLREYYEDRKKRQSFFSYRLFGQKAHVDGSYLAKVLLGDRHISDDAIKGLAQTCGLKGREADYFEALVHFSKSKTEKQSKIYFDQLLAIKTNNAQVVLANQFEYYRHWHHSALRSVLEYHDFRGDFEALAACLNPSISPTEAKESMDLLLSLRLVRQDDDGRYVQTEESITTGQQWQSIAVETFQEEFIRLSREAVKRHPKQFRDISTVTMTINAKNYSELRNRIREFRKSVINYVNTSTIPDRTYQMNIQFFPLSKFG